MTDTMTDGEALRHWRRERALSQDAAARLWGYSREHWNRMERGQAPVVRALARVAAGVREHCTGQGGRDE